MQNITLSADERTIAEARRLARQRNTTLNQEFRRRLDDYTGRTGRAERTLQVIEDLRKTIKLKGPFTREQLNER